MGTHSSTNMMKVAIFACLAGVALCAPLTEVTELTEASNLFTQFKADFHKVYAEANEEAMRFGIFSKSVSMIAEFNQHLAPTQGFSMGINQFSDMTDAETKSFLNYDASAKQVNDVVMLDATNLTSAVDWVTKGAVTPVKNQQQCGSCWAFSTTGSIEGALQIAGNKLVSLSEQQLVDCAGASYGNKGCHGGLPDNGFKYVEKYGLEVESDYPYVAKTMKYVGTCDTAKQSAADGVKPGKISSFKDVTPSNCAQMMAAVSKGPVSVGIDAQCAAFMNYKNGILSSSCGTQLDHAVLVVGYGTDAGTDYWKVKNSWGTVWGDDGYVRMKKSCTSSGRRLLGGGGGGGGGPSGICGILANPSYPVV